MRFTLAFLLAALAALVTAPQAAAHVVDRSSVTVSRLADESHRIVVARVEAAGPVGVRLTVLRVLRGAAAQALVLPPSSDPGCSPTWEPGATVALFLGREDAAPATAWHVVPLRSEAEVAAFAAALEALAPTLGAADATPLGDAPRAARFALLGSPVARLRDDAALDLAGWRGEAALRDAERSALRGALDGEQPGAEVMALAARWPEAAFVPSLLRAARAASEEPAAEERRAVAARALVACGGVEAVSGLAADLQSAELPVALRAARALGAANGPEAARALARALADERAPLRAELVRALARTDAPAAHDGVLEALGAFADAAPAAQARRAVAALARLGAGPALRRLEADHADAGVRALAGSLRRDPLEADALLDAAE